MSTPAAEAYAQTQKQIEAPRASGRELTHSDRCDQCGAAAWVKTESYYSTLPLLWCAHHFTEHERNGHFTEETHSIVDERPSLYAAVNAQANYAGVGA